MKMGRLGYVIEGIMIGRFALVSVPAEYHVTALRPLSWVTMESCTRRTWGLSRLKLSNKWSSTTRTRLGRRLTTSGRAGSRVWLVLEQYRKISVRSK